MQRFFIYFCKTLYMFQTGFSAYHQELKTPHTASGICMYSYELPMMDGNPVRNMQSVLLK